MASQLVSKFGMFGIGGAADGVPFAAALTVARDVGRLGEQTEKMQAIKPDNPSNVRGVKELNICRATVSEIMRNSAEVKQQPEVEESISSSYSR